MACMRDPEGMEARKLIRACQLKGKQVLEIGCGDGWLTRQYAGDAKKVVGIDPNPPEIQKDSTSQPSKISNVAFVQAAGEGLPIAGGIFDVVVFSNSL